MNETIRRIREAPIERLLAAYNFRRERNRWACHAHNDDHPSCTIRHNRLRCWVCDRTWSNIDLVMELAGITLSEAMTALGTLYGIPTTQLPPEERERYLLATEGAPALAQRFADFARGLEIISGKRLEAAHLVGVDPEQLVSWHEQAYALRTAKAHDLARLWDVMVDHRDPIEKLGRIDREHAQDITELLVGMLSLVQTRYRSAA